MPLREGEGHCWSSSYKGVRDRCGLCKIATARRPTLARALELERDTPYREEGIFNLLVKL